MKERIVVVSCGVACLQGGSVSLGFESKIVLDAQGVDGILINAERGAVGFVEGAYYPLA